MIPPHPSASYVGCRKQGSSVASDILRVFSDEGNGGCFLCSMPPIEGQTIEFDHPQVFIPVDREHARYRKPLFIESFEGSQPVRHIFVNRNAGNFALQGSDSGKRTHGPFQDFPVEPLGIHLEKNGGKRSHFLHLQDFVDGSYGNDVGSHLDIDRIDQCDSGSGRRQEGVHGFFRCDVDGLFARAGPEGERKDLPERIFFRLVEQDVIQISDGLKRKYRSGIPDMPPEESSILPPVGADIEDAVTRYPCQKVPGMRGQGKGFPSPGGHDLQAVFQKEFFKNFFSHPSIGRFSQTGVCRTLNAERQERPVACNILPVFSEERGLLSISQAMERWGKSGEGRYFSVRFHFPGFDVRRQHAEEVVSL